MQQLLGIRGPAVGERIDVDDADVAAAVEPATGWAIEQIPGTVIYYEPWFPLSADWEIPGYVIPPDLFPEDEGETPLAIVSISNANPAVVAVAVGEIGKFTNGDTVTIAGATAGYAICNGAHVIGNVLPAGTFTLVGINTSAEGAPSTTPGMTVTPAAP